MGLIDWGCGKGKKGLDWGWDGKDSLYDWTLDSGLGRWIDGMGCVMLPNASHNPAKQA